MLNQGSENKTKPTQKKLDGLNVSFTPDGIVEVWWDEDHKGNVTLSQLKFITGFMQACGAGKKLPALILGKEFLYIGKQEQAYASSEEGQRYTLANAVVITGFATRIAFNLFIKLNPPKTPTRCFSSRESAIAWLISLKD